MTKKQIAAASAAVVLVGGATLLLLQAPPLPALRVSVTQAAPDARYRACFDSLPNAVYKCELRTAYIPAQAPPMQWDPVRIRMDCPASPCCIDVEEWRPDSAYLQLSVIANSYTIDSQPVRTAAVDIDLSRVGDYPASTTSTTAATSTSTLATTTSTTTEAVTTTTAGGCL